MSLCKQGVAKFDLSEYDYLLKSDEDVLYPKEFLEVNTTLDYDLLGNGACLLLKMSTFVQVMNGQFIPNNFHAGLIHDVYSMNGLKKSGDYPEVKPVIARSEYLHPARSFWSGFDQYRYRHNKLGFLKWRILGALIKNPFYLFILLGYLYAGLGRTQRIKLLGG